jgi:hypothetical protein
MGCLLWIPADVSRARCSGCGGEGGPPRGCDVWAFAGLAEVRGDSTIRSPRQVSWRQPVMVGGRIGRSRGGGKGRQTHTCGSGKLRRNHGQEGTDARGDRNTPVAVGRLRGIRPRAGRNHEPTDLVGSAGGGGAVLRLWRLWDLGVERKCEVGHDPPFRMGSWSIACPVTGDRSYHVTS